MSSHFHGNQQWEKALSLSYYLTRNRPISSTEATFRRHGYFRAAILLSVLTYFIYCNPSYSYTYSYLRQRYGWDEGEPILPKLLTLKDSVPPSVGSGGPSSVPSDGKPSPSS